MPGPARTGVLVYAKDPATMSSFYERTLGMKVVHAGAEHRVLASDDAQLIVHAIPAPFADSIVIATPPEAREEQAFKPFYTVASLEEAERTAVACGGRVIGPVWPGPGFTARNVCDTEGNIVHLREFAA